MSVSPSRIAAELALLAALSAAMVGELWLSHDSRTDITPGSVAAVVAATLPVLLRRRHPGIALVACMALLFVVMATSNIYQTVPFPSMVAGYSLALVVDRRVTVLAGLALVPPVLFAIWYFGEQVPVTEVPKNLAFVAAPLLLGAAVRNRRAYLAALVDRAETAERTRDEEARRRVDEERLRIARELHDGVAHAMVAINVQAGVGAHLLENDPEQVRQRLLDIKRVSGEALADLRSTLGLLRHTDEEEGTAPLRPTQGLGELEDLARGLRSAGVDVTLHLDPASGAVPAPVQATCFRIAQEALTNVVRHSGSSQARVRITSDTDRVVLDVEDDGPESAPRPGPRDPATSTGSGNGLRGMRERAAAAGGTLEAGPRAQGGWRVHATLPLVGEPTATPSTPPPVVAPPVPAP